jgi:sugar phosphate isomerase/epimerase
MTDPATEWRPTFMAGCLARTPFRELVPAAASAGFASVTIWPNIWRHALRRDSLTLADMRAMLDGAGLTLTDVDACFDWVPASSAPGPGPMRQRVAREEFFDVCVALGGTTVVAVHQTDAGLDLHRDVAGFAALCDDAAARGLRVVLEFVPFSNVPDLNTAWQIIDEAARPNAGLVLDLGHYVRSGRDDALLARIPPDRVYTVQLCDGPLAAPADLVHEAMYQRMMPGTGEFGVAAFVDQLHAMGVRASYGPELYQPSFDRRPASEIAVGLYRALSDNGGMALPPGQRRPA